MLSLAPVTRAMARERPMLVGPLPSLALLLLGNGTFGVLIVALKAFVH